MKKMQILTAGIIKENPVFVMFLGTCPTLATTGSISSALGMAVAFTAVLILTNVFISAVRKIVPDQIRIPVYIVIIATVVKSVEMLLNAYALPVYESLGVFLALIVVNCIVLGRAEAFASKNGVLSSLLDAIGVSIGFGLSIMLMAVVRQFLGTGGLELRSLFDSTKIVFSFNWFAYYAPKVFSSGQGAFLTFGILAGLFNAVRMRADRKKAAKEVA